MTWTVYYRQDDDENKPGLSASYPSRDAALQGACGLRTSAVDLYIKGPGKDDLIDRDGIIAWCSKHGR